MAEHVTKAELLARLDREQTRLAAVLASLLPAQWTLPGVVGDWSVKDVLAHIIAQARNCVPPSAASA
jgi:hypothetical protein